MNLQTEYQINNFFVEQQEQQQQQQKITYVETFILVDKISAFYFFIYFQSQIFS